MPFPAGSSTDIVSRMMAQKFSTKLGQQFVVENRAGASGNLGVDMVAKAAPDGYTMGLITASTHGVAPALGTKLPYDPMNDFKPVSMIGAAPYVLVLYPGIPAKSMSELVALAKTKPGQLNYGSAGLASLAHLAAALFASDTEHRAHPHSLQELGAVLDRHHDRPPRHAVRDRGPDAGEHPRRQAAGAGDDGQQARVVAAGRADHDGIRREGLRRGALDGLCDAAPARRTPSSASSIAR